MELVTQYLDQFTPDFTKHQQIEQINQVLIEIAGGNYHETAPISDKFDEIDAIASGVNMLSEELRDTVISRNYLDSILRTIVDMLFIFDKQFVIQQITPKACELLKQPKEHFIDQPINVLFDGRKKRFLQRMKESVSQNGKLHNIETSFKIPHKEKLPVTLSLFTLKNNQDVITGYLMIAVDVKDRVRTSNTLKRRDEELNTLIYRTSHDLKGPLASMLGLFQVLEKEKQDLPTLQYYLSLVKGSAEKLNKTLSGLLEVGRVDNSDLSMQPFLLYDIIEEVVSSLDNYPGREKVEIKTCVDEKLKITSCEKLVRSILQNLIENSIKYRQSNSRNPAVTFININARARRNRINFSVKDNGQGMDKNVLKRAFDMFYRGNLNSKGSGLGLFIVKSNVEKLGGEVKINSKMNEGTEIKISLPFMT